MQEKMAPIQLKKMNTRHCIVCGEAYEPDESDPDYLFCSTDCADKRCREMLSLCYRCHAGTAVCRRLELGTGPVPFAGIRRSAIDKH